MARLRVALFATDVPNVLAAKCACVLFVVAIVSLRLDLGWARPSACCAGLRPAGLSSYHLRRGNAPSEQLGASDVQTTDMISMFFEHVVYTSSR